MFLLWLYVVYHLVNIYCNSCLFMWLFTVNSVTDYLKDAWSLVSGVWKCSAEYAAYIIDLEDNLASLMSESLKLKNKSKDVATKVGEIEGQQNRVRDENQVHGWLKRVEDMESEVEGIKQKAEQELGNKCLGGYCPKNCCSSYKVGKNVLEMIPRVTKLTEDGGKLDVVADELPPPPVEELLRDSLASLRSAMVKLRNLKEDVINRVTVAEKQRMKRTNQVNGWLTSVEAVEKEGNQLLQKGGDLLKDKCVTSSSHKLLEEVKKMVPQVTTLTEEGEFDVVAHQLPSASVDEQPMDNAVVGFESKFEEVWHSVQNNDSLVIGLVGMGGVGKTTLLKQLNNEFLKATHGYDLVVWIVVSKPANLGSIRDALRSKLSIPDHMWHNESEDQKKSLLFSQLKEKKFVVLLDDMWETLKLSDVGIPRPSMDSLGSKIVLTTRSQEVCQSMGADKIIPVDCLPPHQAFSLFCSQLGEDILKSHPQMQGLIADVAQKCDGLPLALCTIGRAMRGKTNAQQWKEAKRTLEKYPSTFPGMEGVFSKLVFSYDSLPNPTVKKCFEYCSLYPEDHNISEEEVIKLWMAEGFISEYDSMYDALIQGRQIVESLKQACLLETGEYDHRKNVSTVRMHDMIREMALWMACEQGKKRNKFRVQVASTDIVVAPNAMSNAEKIYLQGSGITTESLKGMSFSPKLSTLIVRDTIMEEWSREILHSRDSLKVLDLMGNSGLWDLRVQNCCLENLEYLNIAGTNIMLHPCLSQFQKLRFLIVEARARIFGVFISSLSSLQMFEQQHTLPLWDDENSSESKEREMLHELEGLKYIMDIRLVLCSATGIEILMDSPKLLRCTTRLAVQPAEGELCGISEIKLRPSLANNLCEIFIGECGKIQNLSSLIYAPNLSILDVRSCSSMLELIGEETRSSNEGTSLFSSLTYFRLVYLPELRSICPQRALPFPSLKYMLVHECDNLVKLPLDSNTARTTPSELEIIVKREWWDGLEWDSQATKDAFTPKFIDA